jgi:two-component system NtrC family response regulator
VAIDVRVVAATQEPLTRAVADGRFRADLHARLDGLTVVLPPLRARKEDIVPLFLRFLEQQAGETPPELEPKLVEALCLYDWPLNVRELLLLSRRLLAVHGGERTLRKSHLPERLLRRGPADAAAEDRTATAKAERRPTDDEHEFDALVQALRGQEGNVSRAAQALGITRARAYRLLSVHPEFSVESARR